MSVLCQKIFAWAMNNIILMVLVDIKHVQGKCYSLSHIKICSSYPWMHLCSCESNHILISVVDQVLGIYYAIPGGAGKIWFSSVFLFYITVVILYVIHFAGCM